jgi:hypothetical protein
MSPHQQHAGSTPSGKLVAFIFFGLIPASEQGKLIVDKVGRRRNEKEE